MFIHSFIAKWVSLAPPLGWRYLPHINTVGLSKLTCGYNKAYNIVNIWKVNRSSCNPIINGPSKPIHLPNAGPSEDLFPQVKSTTPSSSTSSLASPLPITLELAHLHWAFHLPAALQKSRELQYWFAPHSICHFTIQVQLHFKCHCHAINAIIALLQHSYQSHFLAPICSLQTLPTQSTFPISPLAHLSCIPWSPTQVILPCKVTCLNTRTKYYPPPPQQIISSIYFIKLHYNLPRWLLNLFPHL